MLQYLPNNFLDSTLLLSLTTLVVGAVALVVYYKQKSDSKKDAANIIYLEIISAERVMKKAKEDLEKKLDAQLVLTELAMNTESWSKHKYLFVRDFQPVEWDSLTNFYSKAKQFDEAVTHNSSMFVKNEEQIRINLAKYLTTYISDHKIDMSKFTTAGFIDDKEKTKWRKLLDEINNFQTMLITASAQYVYRPQKPVDDAKLYLDNVDLEMSQSSVGIKLKKLAGIEN